MNAILNAKSKRSELLGALNMLIDQLPVLVPNGTFVINGKTFKTADVVANAKALLVAMAATDAVRKQETDTTKAELDLRATLKGQVTSVRASVLGNFGATSTQAATLGFEPKPRSKSTPEAAAAAVAKRAQTRLARHTMGKKQKAAIHGAAPAAPATPTTTK